MSCHALLILQKGGGALNPLGTISNRNEEECWVKIYSYIRHHRDAIGLSLTCKAALQCFKYFPLPNLNAGKCLWMEQTLESTDSSRVKIFSNWRGVFLNHPDDDIATGSFVRTLFETFLPGRGAYETRKSSQTVQNQIYRPSLCPKPDGVSSHLTILWGGHATFLMEYKSSQTAAGIKLVIDPNFSSTIPLLATVEYPRMIPPGITKDMIQDVDLCLITHNHIDHCDEEMIQEMSRNKSLVLLGPEKTPARLAAKFKCRGSEHKWWDQTTVFYHAQDVIHITALPAHHSSAGRDVKAQEEGWCGWKISFRQSQNTWYTIYCMGDTSCHHNPKVQGTNEQHHSHHFKMFNQIKQELGHVNLALVPIDPPTGEESTHLNVYQSADLYKQHLTDVDHILPMHYGTWCWGAGCNPEKILYPHELFESILEKKKLDGKLFFIQVGQSVPLF